LDTYAEIFQEVKHSFHIYMSRIDFCKCCFDEYDEVYFFRKRFFVIKNGITYLSSFVELYNNLKSKNKSYCGCFVRICNEKLGMNITEIK
jgi:hypothetical protein